VGGIHTNLEKKIVLLGVIMHLEGGISQCHGQSREGNKSQKAWLRESASKETGSLVRPLQSTLGTGGLQKVEEEVVPLVLRGCVKGKSRRKTTFLHRERKTSDQQRAQCKKEEKNSEGKKG